MSKFMFLTNMPVLTFAGLKNGSVVPDSKDSVTIEFLVKLYTIYTVSGDILHFQLIDPCGLQSMQGPGLFHFRATVETNSSFCNLTAYFTVSDT